ncbi:MAG: MBL fold metallo-hydrolase [Candidatus Micrarchaeaceae archaeon]
MEISFLGGAGEVGRSGILLKGKKKILLDYGVKINGNTEYPLPAGNIDAFVLSHAHLDHCGDAPSLYHYGSPPTFGTPPTLELSELLIADSIKINMKNHTRLRYNKKDSQRFSNKYFSYNYDEPFEFNDYEITFSDAGHICGSAIIKIQDKKSERSIVYTGDLKVSPQTLHNGSKIVKGDTLIIESTYGSRDHPDRKNLEKLFIENIKKIIENKGIALLPVFAVGRSQEMLALLEKNNLSDITYVDGMSRKATGIVMEHLDYIQNHELLKRATEKVTQILKSRDRERALHGGNIILTTAGMLNGGPVLDYITKLNKNSMIFLTGYQAEGTNGRKLMEYQPINIDERKYHIKNPFAFYDFSAHAGQSDLYKYIKESSPEEVICVHGDEESSMALKDWLELEGFKAHVPHVGDKIKINM